MVFYRTQVRLNYHKLIFLNYLVGTLSLRPVSNVTSACYSYCYHNTQYRIQAMLHGKFLGSHQD